MTWFWTSSDCDEFTRLLSTRKSTLCKFRAPRSGNFREVAHCDRAIESGGSWLARSLTRECRQRECNASRLQLGKWSWRADGVGRRGKRRPTTWSRARHLSGSCSWSVAPSGSKLIDSKTCVNWNQNNLIIIAGGLLAPRVDLLVKNVQIVQGCHAHVETHLQLVRHHIVLDAAIEHCQIDSGHLIFGVEQSFQFLL